MGEQTEPQIVYPGTYIRVREQFEPQPLGGTQRFEIVEHKDGVAMVAVRRGADDRLEVALVRQRRPAVDRDLWEIPAGLVDGSTSGDPLATAKRELREEIGYAAEDWRLLTRELCDPGFSTHAISIYLASGVHPTLGATPDTSADPTEITAVRWLPLVEALRLCHEGAIDDGKTLLGLHLADELLDQTTLKGVSMSIASRVSAPADVATNDAGLKIENMMLEEFNYASSTAYQAMEDRARIFNLYLVLVGVFVSGLSALYQFSSKNGVLQLFSQPLAIVLLLIVGMLGFVFFLQLIQLRQTYRESLITMNIIKEYYIGRFKDEVKDIDLAFPWRLATIPAGERFGSVTFLVCTTVAALGSLCLSGAAFVGSAVTLANNGDIASLLDDPRPYIIAAGVFIVAMAFHIVIYRRMTSKTRDRRQIERAKMSSAPYHPASQQVG